MTPRTPPASASHFQNASGADIVLSRPIRTSAQSSNSCDSLISRSVTRSLRVLDVLEVRDPRPVVVLVRPRL